MLNTKLQQLKYFTLDLLTMENLLTLATPVVKTGQIFGTSNEFHDDGLFSTTIFGETSSRDRMTSNGHVDLRINILHPLVYLGLVSMSSLYKGIIHGERKAIWDSKLSDFVESDKGETGYLYFVSKLGKIKYNNPSNSDLREFKIKLMNIKDVKLLEMNKQFVIAAGLRDYIIDVNGRPSQDDINELYRSSINTSNLIENISDDEYNPYIDNIRMKLQLNALKVYQYLLNIIDGKRGIIQNSVMSKNIAHGTRNVITANSSSITKLGKGNHLRFNEMNVGLYQYAKATSPIAIERVKSMFSRVVSADEKTLRVIDIKTLETHKIEIPIKVVDEYTTNKGVNSYINKFSDIAFSKQILGGSTYTLFMMLVKGKNYTLVDDMDTVEKDDYKYLRPITNMELLYISIVDKMSKFYASTTRYPAINQGSTFPVLPSVKPTTHMLTDITLRGGFEEMVLFNYPDMESNIFDSLSPHHTKLARATADFDGDMMNFVVFFSVESNAEIKRLLQGRSFYLGADGRLAYSVSTDTLKYTVKSMHRLSQHRKG